MALIDMILGTDPEERKNRYQEGGQAVGANIVPPEVSRPPITEQASPVQLPDQQMAIPADPIKGSEMIAMLGEGQMDLTPSEKAPTQRPAAPLQDQYAEVDALFAPSVLMDEQKQAHQLVDPDQMQAFIDEYGVDEAKKMLSAGMKTWQSKNIVETGDEGIIDRFTSGLTNLFGDESRMTRLALAFNSMRLNPDQGLASVLGKRLEVLDKQRLARTKAPVYAKKLRAMGYPDYADIILANPDQAEDIFKQVIQKQLEKKSSVKTSGVQTDEATGFQYVVTSDAEGKQSVEYLTDAQGNKIKGVSAKQKAEIEAAQKAKENDVKLAQEKSEDLVKQADNIGSQIRNLEEIDKQIAQGANTGMFANLFPTIRTSTIALQNAVNRLGLDVIGGTTFGALSESELKFALETAVPTNMDEAELQKWVREKIRVQKILERELLGSARQLSGGMGWGDWVKKRDEAAQASQARQESAPQQTAPTSTTPTADQQRAAQEELRRRGLIK